MKDSEARVIFEQEWPKYEKEIETMARKNLFIRNWEFEDFMQEFRIEAYKAVQWCDPAKSQLRSFMWNLIKKRKADLVREHNTQGRAHWREDNYKWIDTQASSEFSEDGESTNGIVLADDFHQIVRDQIGNAGRFSTILNLKTVDQLDKAVMFCLALGMGIAETVDQMRKDIDPDFDHKIFYKIRKRLEKNGEIQALMA